MADRTWRDDISGLRGLAFLLVLFYHLDSSVLRSGFLGVDLFFVISGFLITGAVQQEMVQDGSFSITNFIARRAKRLLPTAAFAAVVVVVLNRWLLEPTRRAGAIADETERADIIAENMVEHQLGFSESKLLEKIEYALEQLDNGTYGICDECQKEINIERLKAKPSVSLCIACQTAKERAG